MPSMGKIAARYVILCLPMADRVKLEENCRSLSFGSLAVVSDSGALPLGWNQWDSREIKTVYLCKSDSTVEGHPV